MSDLAQRLGLRRQDPSDETKISRPLLDLLERHELDFHSTFRTISTFKPSLVRDVSLSEELKSFVNKILELSPSPKVNESAAVEELIKWLHDYGQRIESEKEDWKEAEDIDAAREKEMKSVNPRFVLRQWLLEEVIKRVERDSQSGKRVLAKVMHVSFCANSMDWRNDQYGFRWLATLLNHGVRKRMRGLSTS
jgi:uncharacterized protein YdiU (UPF0061 family)